MLGLLLAITFTGLTTQDFQTESCIADPGGRDVGMPSAFGTNQPSGFDINRLCFSYDPSNDSLYVGVETFLDPSGHPQIFGDADGDGDPSISSTTLQTLLGQDSIDLGTGEFFTFVIDFNNDGAADLVTGLHSTNDLVSFGAFGGVAQPDNNLFLAPLSRFYGASIAGVAGVVAASPSQTKPHLEFWVSGLQNVPGYSSLNFSNPDSSYQLYVTTGSLTDDGISEEYFPNVTTWKPMKVGTLLDSDQDTINDTFDTDNDNDTIPDSLEKEPGSPDTDGDGKLDYLDTDSDGDGILDSLEAGSPPGKRDSDGDGIPDFRETDSDADGLLDKAEDANQNGKLDGSETDVTKADTDGDGLCDGTLVIGSCTGSEVIKKTDPQKADTDGDGLCDGAIVVSPCFGAEANFNTDPLVPNIFPASGSGGVTPTKPSSPIGGGTVSEKPLGGDVDTTQGGVRLQGAGCSFVPTQTAMAPFFGWFLLIFFGLISRVWALNVDHYRSPIDGLGFLNFEVGKTLPPKAFSMGLSQHIVHNPLGFGQTSTGRSLDNVVSFFYVWDLWGALGLFEDFDIGIGFPVSFVTQVEDLNSSVERNTSSVGDLRLQAKWHLFHYLGLLTFLNFPSGNSDDFFGEGKVTGGLKILADTKLGSHQVGANLGVFARSSEDITASNIRLLEVGPEMLWNLGWRWLLSPSHQWFLMSHLWGKTDFDSQATSPTEWDFGFAKIFEKSSLEANLNFGVGLGKGYGSPTYRIVIGLSYVSERSEK